MPEASLVNERETATATDRNNVRMQAITEKQHDVLIKYGDSDIIELVAEIFKIQHAFCHGFSAAPSGGWRPFWTGSNGMYGHNLSSYRTTRPVPSQRMPGFLISCITQ